MRVGGEFAAGVDFGSALSRSMRVSACYDRGCRRMRGGNIPFAGVRKMKNVAIGNRVISLLTALLIFGLLLQGCGDDEPAVHPIEGKWNVSEKGTANDPKNNKVNRFILEFAIYLYKKNLEIKLMKNPKGFIFSFDDCMGSEPSGPFGVIR